MHAEKQLIIYINTHTHIHTHTQPVFCPISSRCLFTRTRCVFVCVCVYVCMFINRSRRLPPSLSHTYTHTHTHTINQFPHIFTYMHTHTQITHTRTYPASEGEYGTLTHTLEPALLEALRQKGVCVCMCVCVCVY